MGRVANTPRLAWCAGPHLETVHYRLAVKVADGLDIAEPDSQVMLAQPWPIRCERRVTVATRAYWVTVLGVAGGEQRHVVASHHEAFGAQGGEQLPRAVVSRGQMP
jgi:hypothetical protein